MKHLRRVASARVGWGLVVLSTLGIAGLLLVPFAPLPTEGKLVLTSVLVVVGEVCFWVGGAILGKEAVSRFWRGLNPLEWFRKRE